MALDRSNPVMFVRIGPAGSQSFQRIPVAIRLESLTFDEEERKQDVLSIMVDNHDLANFDTPLFAVGNVIEAVWGYPGAMSRVRECTITKITGSLKLKVECKGAAHVVNLVQQCRIFNNMKRSDIAAQIATEEGYSGANQLIQPTKTTLDQVLQVRMTNAQFLRDMAQRENYGFYIDSYGFHFHARKLLNTPTRTFEYFVGQGNGDIESFNVEGDITAKPAVVIASGRDPLLKSNFAVYSDNQNQPGRPTNASQSIFKAAAVYSASGALTVDPAAAADEGATTRRGTTRTTSDDAQTSVNASQSTAEQKAVKVTLHCVGDALIEAKQTVTLKGFGQTLNGNYYVAGAKHTLGPGYKMVLKLHRSGVGSSTGLGANADPSDGTDNTGTGPTAASQVPTVQFNPDGSVSWVGG